MFAYLAILVGGFAVIVAGAIAKLGNEDLNPRQPAKKGDWDYKDTVAWLATQGNKYVTRNPVVVEEGVMIDPPPGEGGCWQTQIHAGAPEQVQFFVVLGNWETEEELATFLAEQRRRLEAGE